MLVLSTGYKVTFTPKQHIKQCFWLQVRRRGPPTDLETSDMKILTVESHSRSEQDWYAATVALDVLAFLYVVIFFQVWIQAPVEKSPM